LSDKQQQILQKAFNKQIDNMWSASEVFYGSAQNCLLGKDSCQNGAKYKLMLVNLSNDDLSLLKQQAKAVSFKKWGDMCDKEYPGCSEEWVKVTTPVVDLH
jgi:hypothetical protein